MFALAVTLTTYKMMSLSGLQILIYDSDYLSFTNLNKFVE